MAVDRKRASSERLPQASRGTVLSREELRRQLSESNKSSTDTPTHKRASATGEEYALPIKNKQTESSQSKKPVLFDDGVPTYQAPGRPVSLRSKSKQMCGVVGVASNQDDGALEADVRLFEDERGKAKGVVELSTLRQNRVPHIKVRVICLIDVSGSMLLKGDKHKQRSKISILKDMAVDVIDALEDDEDYFGVMTFGEKSRVICPLAKVSSATRSQVKETVSNLDKSGSFSAVTDLSSALVQAVDLLNKSQTGESLLYRNCIIVFSDGEVNAGETNPVNLVHVTREKIREVGTPEGVLGDLWVNVSCVATGTHFSQALYILSKMCGSDAYFFVDGSKDHPESDMLVPLMLRKTACAQMVSVTVSASRGATLVSRDCSQEYSVRRRGRREPEGSETMSYFVHDMPTGVKKTFNISLDLAAATKSPGLSSDHTDAPVVTVSVQYVDAEGVLHNLNKSVQREQVFSLQGPTRQLAVRVMADTAMASIRQAFQNACRAVAELLEDESNHDDDPEELKNSVNFAVQTGREELQYRTKQVLPYLDEDPALRAEFQTFADAVTANLGKLQSLVTRHVCSGTSGWTKGKGWQIAKAMSSAICRQLPTISSVLVKPEVVCPLPEAKGCESRRTQALSMFVFGGGGMGGDDEEQEADGSPLHNAAKDVARRLADVCNAIGIGSE